MVASTYSREEEVIEYLAKRLNVPTESLGDNSLISRHTRDSIDLFQLELDLEEKYSRPNIDLREKIRTVRDLMNLVSN